MNYRTCSDEQVARYTYDPISGAIRIDGKIATYRMGRYLAVNIDGINILAHRLAWRLHTGDWPADQLDHENTNKTDNRFNNMREANNSQNGANKVKYRNNRTGYKGVTPWFNGRYRAQIKKNGRVRHLGVFDCPKEAHAAYCSAASELHGEFARA